MKLISEDTNNNVGFEIVESVDVAGAPKRDYYITGIFSNLTKFFTNPRTNFCK